MTPDDLASIRAAHVESMGDDMCLECEVRWPCDAITLLAEVDRLEGVLDVWQRAMPLSVEEGAKTERARILAAVEALLILIAHGRYEQMTGRQAAVAALSDVIAAIEGKEGD